MTITRATPLADLPELLRVSECAEWADTSAGAIYEAVRRGDLPSVRLGRLVRIPRAGLARLIEGKGADV